MKPHTLIKCLAIGFEGPAGSAWLPNILGALPSKLAARDLGNRISYATNFVFRRRDALIELVLRCSLSLFTLDSVARKSCPRSLDITEVLIFYSTESAIFVLGHDPLGRPHPL